MNFNPVGWIKSHFPSRQQQPTPPNPEEYRFSNPTEILAALSSQDPAKTKRPMFGLCPAEIKPANLAALQTLTPSDLPAVDPNNNFIGVLLFEDKVAKAINENKVPERMVSNFGEKATNAIWPCIEDLVTQFKQMQLKIGLIEVRVSTPEHRYGRHAGWHIDACPNSRSYFRMTLALRGESTHICLLPLTHPDLSGEQFDTTDIAVALHKETAYDLIPKTGECVLFQVQGIRHNPYAKPIPGDVVHSAPTASLYENDLRIVLICSDIEPIQTNAPAPPTAAQRVSALFQNLVQPRQKSDA